MLKRDLEALLDILKKLEEHELMVAELYQTCSKIWLEDKEFWTNMEQAELKHAQSINRMRDLIGIKPERVEWGHPFKPAALQTAMSGIRLDLQRLRRREIARDRMLFIARDIEQSIIENRGH